MELMVGVYCVLVSLLSVLVAPRFATKAEAIGQDIGGYAVQSETFG